MNKVSTEIDSFLTYVGVKDAIKMAKNAGFDYFNFDLCHICDYDFQNDKPAKIKHPLSGRKYKKYLLDLKKYADDLGIKCNQTHAPFPIHQKAILNVQKKAVKATCYIGAKIMVMHPDSFKSVDENVKILRKVALFAKKYGVKIAIENTWNWSGTKAIYCAGSTPESLFELINRINLDNVGACLDTGHAEIMGDLASSVRFINTLKDKLFATHIHDNDLHNDKHQIPFSNSIDFLPICKALKAIKYKGELTLEAIYYYRTNPNGGQTMVDNLYASIDKINRLVNE